MKKKKCNVDVRRKEEKKMLFHKFNFHLSGYFQKVHQDCYELFSTCWVKMNHFLSNCGNVFHQINEGKWETFELNFGSYSLWCDDSFYWKEVKKKKKKKFLNQTEAPRGKTHKLSAVWIWHLDFLFWVTSNIPNKNQWKIHFRQGMVPMVAVARVSGGDLCENVPPFWQNISADHFT